MTQPIPKESLDYEEYVDGLRRSNAALTGPQAPNPALALKSLRLLLDRNRFNGALEVIKEYGQLYCAYALAKLEKDRNASAPVQTITVHVEGGLVQDVTGIPAGYEVRVEDYDHSDHTQPTWDVEKECHVTVYGGDGV